MNGERELREYPLKLDYSDQDSVATDHGDDPHIYNNKWEYIMTALGVCVGYGSFWRFPSLVFRNGGGVFLIPYLIAMVFMGVPLYYMETAVGQMHRTSIPFSFRNLHPSLKIVGLAIMTTTITFTLVYNILLTYCYRFLFVSFQSPLPFAEERIIDNTFFHEEILNQSSSINEFGSINPFLLVLFIGSLLLCHFVIEKGAKSSGKVIIFTATAPFFIFFILILRGLFLSGAWEGIVFLFKPNWSRLWTTGIWIDAIVQVFYQLSVGYGAIVTLSMQKARRDDILKSVMIVPLGLVLCGLLSALTIFIYLSHFCLEKGFTIGDPRLGISGFQLSFNVLPKALLLLPLPNLWIFIFFLAMILLGIDSEFGTMESIYCWVRDQFKHGPRQIFGVRMDKKRGEYLILFILSLGAIPLTSGAGIYYLDYFDYYMSNIPFSLWAFLELFFFIRVFDFEDFAATIKRYTKQEVPCIVKYCLTSYWLPGLLLANIFFAAIDQLLSFRRFSSGFYLFGWFITLYPIFMIYWFLRKEWKGWEQVNTTFKAIAN